MEPPQVPCDFIPYCDVLTCTQSCIQYLNLDVGKCIENVCYCDQSVITPKPVKPEEDWSYDKQDGKYFKK